MIENKYDVKIDDIGYIVKKDSYNTQVAQSFVNQIADDELTLSDFSIWKSLDQTDWSGGFNYEKRDFSNVYYHSHDIDIHYKTGQFRLSRNLSDNLDTTPVMSDIIRVIHPFNGKIYIASGTKVFESNDGTEGSFVLANDCGTAILDLVIFNNYLYAMQGTNGYYRYDPSGGGSWTQESDGSQAPAGYNEKINYAITWTPASTTYIYGVYDNVLRRGEWNIGAGAIEWTDVKEFDEDVNMYLTKPVIYQSNLFFWTKRGSDVAGPSMLYIHDGSDTAEVYGFDSTAGVRMKVYNNKLFFFMMGRNFSYWYNYDGTNFTVSLKLEGEAGGSLYDSFTYTDPTGNPTGGPTGSETYYDSGLEVLSDPVYWSEHDGKLFCTVRSTSAANYLYEYDGTADSWARVNLFDLAPQATYCLGVFNKELYIGNDIGEIRTINPRIYSEEGYLVSSIYDANLINVDKLIKEVEIVLQPLDSGCDIEVEYDLEESGSWTSLVLPTLLGGDTSIRIPISTGGANVVARKFRIKVTLTTIDPTTTPKITDILTKYYPFPDTLKRWQLTLLCIDGLQLHDGTPETKTAANLISGLWNAKNTKTIKVFKDIDYVETTLSGNLLEDASIIPVVSTDGFPQQGEIQIETERIKYIGKSDTTFRNCTRGWNGTVAIEHINGTAVDNSYRVLFKDMTVKDHNINQTDGLEGLAQVILYKSL